MALVSTSGGASSTGLERDALRATGGQHGAIAPADVALGVIIGRTSEAFSFFVYGIASVLVFPQVVFPFAAPNVAILYSFAVFSLSFLARPVGSVTFMWVDRHFGRGTKLTVALVLLGGSTASIAFLPPYSAIGYLSILGLILFRCGQGFALGGAWDGLSSLLALNAPANKRGRFAMIPQLGAPFGFMIAAGLFAFFLANIDEGDFLDWGWRYMFFVAFVINVVALFARLRLIATKEFVELYESRALQPSPVIAMLRANWRVVLIGAFVPLSSYALYHLVSIYPVWYVGLDPHRSIASFLLIQCVGAVMQVIGTVASGEIADGIGRRNLIGTCAVGIVVLGLITPFLFESAGGETVFVLLGFGLLGLAFGQAGGAVASNFSNNDRYTGSALTTDLAWMIGAGFAPLVAIGAYELAGSWAVCAYLISGAACTGAALFFNKRLAVQQVEAPAATHAAAE